MSDPEWLRQGETRQTPERTTAAERSRAFFSTRPPATASVAMRRWPCVGADGGGVDGTAPGFPVPGGVHARSVGPDGGNPGVAVSGIGESAAGNGGPPVGFGDGQGMGVPSQADAVARPAGLAPSRRAGAAGQFSFGPACRPAVGAQRRGAAPTSGRSAAHAVASFRKLKPRRRFLPNRPGRKGRDRLPPSGQERSPERNRPARAPCSESWCQRRFQSKPGG